MERRRYSKPQDVQPVLASKVMPEGVADMFYRLERALEAAQHDGLDYEIVHEAPYGSWVRSRIPELVAKYGQGLWCVQFGGKHGNWTWQVWRVFKKTA